MLISKVVKCHLKVNISTSRHQLLSSLFVFYNHTLVQWCPQEPENTIAFTALLLKGKNLFVEFKGAPAFTRCSTMAGVSEARLLTVDA